MIVIEVFLDGVLYDVFEDSENARRLLRTYEEIFGFYQNRARITWHVITRG